MSDEFGEFGMFSVKGGRKVRSIVNKVLRLKITATDKDIYDLLTSEFNKIRPDFPEVWDTDVRSSVIHFIERKTNRELSIFF